MNYCLNTKASDDVCLSTPEIKSGKVKIIYLSPEGLATAKVRETLSSSELKISCMLMQSASGMLPVTSMLTAKRSPLTFRFLTRPSTLRMEPMQKTRMLSVQNLCIPIIWQLALLTSPTPATTWVPLKVIRQTLPGILLVLSRLVTMN